MAHIDWSGLSVFLGSLGVFLAGFINTIFQVINFIDARRAKKEQAEHKEILGNIAVAVGAKQNDSN